MCTTSPTVAARRAQAGQAVVISSDVEAGAVATSSTIDGGGGPVGSDALRTPGFLPTRSPFRRRLDVARNSQPV
jgi:hypothetical protein